MSEPEYHQLIIAHPMNANHPVQGGGIRYLMNIMNGFYKLHWSILVFGHCDDEQSKNKVQEIDEQGRWEQRNLSVSHKGWVSYLLNLYIKLPFLKIPPEGIVMTHRVDCMLAFVLFKHKNPKILICAVPGYFLRTNHPLFNRWFGWLYNFVERVCIRQVDAIIPVDKGTMQYLNSRHPNANLSEIIPSGIDFTSLKMHDRSQARQILNLSPDIPIVVFAGRLSKVKNIPFLMKSFALVNKEIPKSLLLILGEGEEREKIGSLAASISPNIVLLGAIAPDSICIYYSAANVATLCSLEEGSPTVIKEALACGIPVISTDVGDVSEILTRNYLGSIAKNDLNDFALLIKKYLVKDDSLENRIKRREYIEKFNVANQVAKVLQVCSKVLDRENSEDINEECRQ
jgi:L-malate glycosyltransferase